MKRIDSPGAFSLVEITVAIGIAAFCLLGIFALLPVGINSNSDSVRTTHAAGLATSIVTDLRGTEIGGTSPIYGLKPDSAVFNSILYLKEDGVKVGGVSEADYRATVTVSPPSANTLAPTSLRVVLSWPAGATNILSSFEADTALDRN